MYKAFQYEQKQEGFGLYADNLVSGSIALFGIFLI